MYFFITILTAIALSLDAFSLSVIYGTILNNKNKIILLSLIVGLFHFFMPLLGYSISSALILKIISKTNIISFIIFFILGIEMFFSKDKDEKNLTLSTFPSMLLFALTVSIDSFSIGIAISNEEILLPILTFSTTSFIFTYLGLLLGNKLNNLFGKHINKIGGVILIVLSFYYLFT